MMHNAVSLRHLQQMKCSSIDDSTPNGRKYNKLDINKAIVHIMTSTAVLLPGESL